MRQLLTNSFQQLFSKGIQLATLIPAEPWLFDYYQSMGFSPTFYYSKQELQVPTNPTNDIRIEKCAEYREDIYQYFNKKQLERNCAILHTPEDFKVILADLSLAKNGMRSLQSKIICI